MITITTDGKVKYIIGVVVGTELAKKSDGSMSDVMARYQATWLKTVDVDGTSMEVYRLGEKGLTLIKETLGANYEAVDKTASDGSTLSTFIYVEPAPEAQAEEETDEDEDNNEDDDGNDEAEDDDETDEHDDHAYDDGNDKITEEDIGTCVRVFEALLRKILMGVGR